jgi:hypothetical protein
VTRLAKRRQHQDALIVLQVAQGSIAIAGKQAMRRGRHVAHQRDGRRSVEAQVDQQCVHLGRGQHQRFRRAVGRADLEIVPQKQTREFLVLGAVLDNQQLFHAARPTRVDWHRNKRRTTALAKPVSPGPTSRDPS